MNFFKQCITTYLSSAKRKPLLYLSIVILQLISLCSVFFSIGLIANANSSFQNADLNERCIYFKTMEDTSEDGEYLFEGKSDKAYEMCMPISQISKGVEMLEDVLGNNLIDIQAWGFMKMPDDKFLSCLTFYVFNNYDYLNPTMQNETVDENKISFHPSVDIPDEWKLSDNKLLIDGREYSYSYCQKEMARHVQMSCGYNTPQSVRCYEFYIFLRQPMLYSEHEKVEDIINSHFNPVYKSMPKVPDLLETQMSNTQMAVAIAFIAVSVLNCSLCYNYIYNSRKKQLSIYRICGATTAECVIIYLAEVIIYSLVAFAASFLVFDGLIKKFVIQMYPLSEPVFTASNLLTIFYIYIILTILIMLISIISFVKKPIMEERK